MRKYFLLLIVSIIASAGFGQTVNVNPDKTQEPWLLGGLRIPSQAELNKIKVVDNVDSFRAKNLPSTLDNSTLPYFRPIFSQSNGSCAQSSGIAYNFTYEMNREHGTSADVSANQYPSHYTYNFLNEGSGEIGSWYQDGWEIIKASGCPTVETYGGLAISDTHWMSGYANYDSGTSNRVSDIFAIDVSTPEGLETLKYWMYDHLEGDADGGIVNFASGINNDDFAMSNGIITKWGYTVNHAMTFVGWDDNIEYDFNEDGFITTTEDINNDGVVDMRDWERGALIMVNSWGTSWGNGGKAYVMYKLLADPLDQGGIFQNQVYSIHVHENYEPQLFAKLKMTHNSRNQIRISFGVTTDLQSEVPEHEYVLPLFSYQGGAYDMQGDADTDPIEIQLDITPLLSYVQPNQDAKYFLIIDEEDPSALASGEITDFSIKDIQNEIVSDSHNVSVVNNGRTLLSVLKSVDYSQPTITQELLPVGQKDNYYKHEIAASGGVAPYKWNIIQKYEQSSTTDNFPDIQAISLVPTDYDDGFVTQSLAFDFPFYDETFNEIHILTDGSIVFEPIFNYLRNESVIKQTKMIAVFASDLMIYPEDGDGIFFDGDANSATIRWKTSLYGNQSANIDAALQIFADGTLKYFYGDNITTGLDWAAGVSRGDILNFEIPSVSGSDNPSNTEFQYTISPFPHGMSMSADGQFNGTPVEIGMWDILFAVTDKIGITKTEMFSFEVGDTPVVSTSNDSKLKVYPNPSSGSVQFLFQEVPISVNLRIYDISGREVYALVQANVLENGILWESGQEIMSGTYFYKIKTLNKVYSGGIVITR